MSKSYKNELPYRDDWKKLSGELPVKMTSDYLFRALLQSDEKTLKAMVAALLHINVEDVTEIEINNPITLGESIDDKEFILDINALLNGSKKINLEMQTTKLADWQDRSLSYACRAFDQLGHGDSYGDVFEIIQISFTDFSIFNDSPKFYSSFKLIDCEDLSRVYSEKFVIKNVDLTHIDMATEEDKAWGVDLWARFFKSKSWEDLKMIATENKSVDQAVSSIWQLTEDDEIRYQIRRREANERAYNKLVEKANLADKLELLLAEKDSKLAEKDSKLAEKDSKLAENESKLAEKDNMLAELNSIIAELENKLAALQSENEN